MLSATDLRYDPDSHTSSLPDGTDVPHVTHILSECRVSTDFEALSGVSPRIAANVQRARFRGTAIHADCHAYDDDDLDLEDVDPRVRPGLDAWIDFRINKGVVPLLRERQVFHRRLLYTGFVDGLFLVGSAAKKVIIDIKNGNPASAAGHLQTAAYEMAMIDMGLIATGECERWAVWLRPGRRVPYTVFPYSSMPDALSHQYRFAACLTVYREQQMLRAKVGR